MVGCPSCTIRLEPGNWTGDRQTACPRCGRKLEWRVFPALFHPPAPPDTSTAALTDESRCFFHADRPAALVCDACGRFICRLCDVTFEGRHLCATCISAGMRKGRFAHLDRGRTRYDSFALTLAIAPLALWPFTLLTAPAAIGVVVFGWRKPRSLVAPNRWRFVVAGILALLQIAGWAFLFAKLAGAFGGRP